MYTTLTEQERNTLAKYINNINEIIDQGQKHKMQGFIIENVSCVREFKLSPLSQEEYASSNISKIFKTLGIDLLLTVKEDLLGIMPYKCIDDKLMNEVECIETKFDTNYFPLLLLNVLDAIKNDLSNIEKSHPLYVLLSTLKEQVSQMYQSINSGTKLYKKVHKLYMKLIKIDLAILKDDLQGDERQKIKELAKKYQARYNSILHEAKQYDQMLLDLQPI